MAGKAGPLLGCWLALLLAVLQPGAVVAQPGNACSRIMMVPTGDWPPYNYFDADQQYRGMDVDLLNAIFAEAKCELRDAPPMPSPRNAMLFEQGQLDLMTGASMTAARKLTARFSRRYRDEVVSLFSLAEHAGRYRDIRNFDQVMRRPLTLLAPRVGWYGEAYEKNKLSLMGSARLSHFIQFDQGITMLLAGRGDLILGDEESVLFAAGRQNVKLKVLPFQVERAPVFLMFNKATTTQADVNTIDAAIERLEKRGELERIRRAYRPATAW
jgi:polar amino acid transport system substrate-binding protein